MLCVRARDDAFGFDGSDVDRCLHSSSSHAQAGMTGGSIIS